MGLVILKTVWLKVYHGISEPKENKIIKVIGHSNDFHTDNFMRSYLRAELAQSEWTKKSASTFFDF